MNALCVEDVRLNLKLRLVGLVLALPLVLLLSSCEGSSPEDATSASPGEFFSGSPEERVVLLRACFEENGVETSQPPGMASDGFAYAVGSVSPDELERIKKLCDEEIGEPQISGLSDGELQSRYDGRVEQWECLVENEFTTGEPISFESFVEDYRRSGEQRLWEPTEGLEVRTINGAPLGPTDACPRTKVW